MKTSSYLPATSHFPALGLALLASGLFGACMQGGSDELGSEALGTTEGDGAQVSSRQKTTAPAEDADVAPEADVPAGPSWGPPDHAELPLERLGPDGPYAYVPHRPGAHQVKGSGHTHSAPDHSGISPAKQQERLRDLPGEHAHDFVWMTSHDFVALDPGVDGIQHMYGIEIYTDKQPQSGSEPHLLAYLPDDTLADASARPFGYFEHDLSTASELVRAVGGVTAWSHPSRQPLTNAELDALEGLWGMEVVSGATDVEKNLEFVDRRLSLGHYVCLTGGGDIHAEDYRLTRGYQVVDVSSPEPSREEIFDEVTSCNFFVCETKNTRVDPVKAPSVQVEGDAIAVSSGTDADEIRFIGKDGKRLRTATGVTEASYRPGADDAYVRAEIVTDGGEARCFSQPVWLLDEVPEPTEALDGASAEP